MEKSQSLETGGILLRTFRRELISVKIIRISSYAANQKALGISLEELFGVIIKWMSLGSYYFIQRRRVAIHVGIVALVLQNSLILEEFPIQKI